MTDLLDKLRHTRAGYAEECTWIRFLMDAYAGTGGFQGQVRQPAVGYWGAAAELYAPAGSLGRDEHPRPSSSYLDRFGREDDDKYRARCDVAHYPNYVGPLTDLKISYLLRKSFSREDVPEVVENWHGDVDGLGGTLDEVRPEIITRAAIAGWAPVLIDMRPTPEGWTVAQAEAAGTGKPRMIPLWPANLLDWSHDGQRFAWVKIRTDHVEQATWDAPARTVRRYAIWTAAVATIYEVVEIDGKDPEVRPPVTYPHSFGRVPLAICRHQPGGDGVTGLPMHGQVSTEARRLFNLISEIDEHVRQQVFAILVLSQRGQNNGGEIQLGTSNGLTIDTDAKNVHYFLAPPASVAATLEKRIEQTIREIYRMARVEFTRPQVAAASGVSRAYEFAQTNRALSDFARHVAAWEEDVDDLVGAALGIATDARAKERVIPPDSFDIEDLSSEIAVTIDAVTRLRIGPTAAKLARLRFIQRMLPRLAPAELEKIEEELETMAEDEARMTAAGVALLDAKTEADPDEDPEGDDPEDDDEEADPEPPVAEPAAA